ncbi:MAG TPA: DUF1493 family protein [Caulobacteraceae bacterium]|jgi:hypothetical protein
MKPVAEVVMALVRRVSGAETIDAGTRLFHDLGLTGEQAIELLSQVGATFDVSFSAFERDRYFPDDDEAVGDELSRLLSLAPRDKAPFTVGHLIAVAETGGWFDPV